MRRADLRGAARSSGVLLHPTSLPSGRLGREAYEFVDWLVAAGQRWWQILPLGPPDGFGSPYTSPSAFAGSPALLAEPDARVSRREVDDFRERHRYWIQAWADYDGGDRAIVDQVRFEREWNALRSYAAARGVRLIGDLPIYVAQESAAVAAHPELFDFDFVAGAAPDAAHPDGQLWGQPIYNWHANRAEGYEWWIERFRRWLQLVDVIRIDHFRGFVAAWAIPASSTNPLEGGWHRGPGFDLFRAVERELGPLPLVAEDLGRITPPVDQLRERIGALGMRILVRSFSRRHRHRQAIGVHPEDAVVYTGTHDHQTLAGWWAEAPSADRRRAEADLAEAGIVDDDPIWALVRLALSSRARIAILPAQDLLELGDEARMNLPGTFGGSNWRWRLPAGALTPALAQRLRAATAASRRVPRAAAQPRRARGRLSRA